MKHNLLRKEEDSRPDQRSIQSVRHCDGFCRCIDGSADRYNITEVFSQEDYTMVKNPGKENMEIITKEGNKINRYPPSEDQDKKEGKRGKKVGIAYELDNGEIIYVPE